MILTVIEHSPTCPVDRFGPWLTQGRPDLELRTVRAWAGDPVPADARDLDGLLVLGGPMHAHDDDASPWLPAVRALLADAVADGLPTLAICLGAQLLAIAAGGRVQVGAPPGTEAGVIDVHPRPDAVHDPLLGALAADVAADHPRAGGVLLAMPSMHSDAVVDLPTDAVWLASSLLYPYQAFRVGPAAWGLQFHPEVGEDVFAAWARTNDDVDAEAVVAELRERDTEVRAGGRALAQSFARIVAARAGALAGARG